MIFGIILFSIFHFPFLHSFIPSFLHSSVPSLRFGRTIRILCFREGLVGGEAANQSLHNKKVISPVILSEAKNLFVAQTYSFIFISPFLRSLTSFRDDNRFYSLCLCGNSTFLHFSFLHFSVISSFLINKP